jgi:hypothetical protein
MDSLSILQEARRRWRAEGRPEWTAEEEEEPSDNHLPTQSSASNPESLLEPPASTKSHSKVEVLSQPDHLATLSTGTCSLAKPTYTLDLGDSTPNELDPDHIDPHEPSYLTENPQFIDFIYKDLINAQQDNALSHPVLGYYLPAIHAHIGSELPPLSYATLYDSTYTATLPDSSGKRRWAFAVVAISDPTNDHESDGSTTATPILPGHYLSLADEVSAIIKWCQKTGLHTRARLTEKVTTAAPLKSSTPVGSHRAGRFSESGHPREKTGAFSFSQSSRYTARAPPADT